MPTAAGSSGGGSKGSGGGKKDKPPPAQPTVDADAAAASGAVKDIEDLTTSTEFGSVEVTQRCCGAMTCRVLAPR